jgi:beta-xylosidase
MGLLLAALLLAELRVSRGPGEAAEPVSETNESPLRRLPGAPVAQSFSELPSVHVTVDAHAALGRLEMWRHSIGQGGISAAPLPERVVKGVKKFEPRLIRIFIQEFFRVYPQHHRYDWSRLDLYMDAMSKTGAKLVAAITIKPQPIFPKVDETIWRPGDVGEWQRVIAALVRRYSVEKPIVTHWEIGNEPDIGEEGGCPYLIQRPHDYAEFYKLTIAPIVATFPQAKVGGPAVADALGELSSGFIAECASAHARLDFVSWHVYSDNPTTHAQAVRRYRKLLSDKFSQANRPELFVTEWNKSFEPISVEEAAYQPRRAAAMAASILALTEEGVDRSFYYHLCDQMWRAEDFRPFFRKLDLMSLHWNQMPHRFGLFGVDECARPQYFVYQLLNRLDGQRAAASCDAEDVHVLAARDLRSDNASVLLVNYGLPTSQDRIATVRFAGLKRGNKRLSTWRIDRSARWSSDRLELLPAEERDVQTAGEFSCQIYSPADSVSLVVLKSAPTPPPSPEK